MISIKIQCGCGQKYAFEIEPADGQMPWAVKCPTCGADGTAVANEIIARAIAGQSIPAIAGPQPPASPPLTMPIPQSGDQNPPLSVAREQLRDRSLADTDDTVASNPARLRPNYIKLLCAAHPLDLMFTAIALVLGLSLGWLTKGPVPVYVLGIVALVYFGRLILEARKKYWDGDVCPGIVISEKPWLVAVMTDLSFSGASNKPAVLVLPQRLDGMTGGTPKVGQPVATVAFYAGPPKDGAWQNFSPEVINCGVTNQAEIQRVMDSITEEEWHALEESLASCPIKKPGLYKMWGANAGKAEPSSPVITAVAVVALVLMVLLAAALIARFAFGFTFQMKPRSNPSSTSVAPPAMSRNFPMETPASRPPLLGRPAAENPARIPQGVPAGATRLTNSNALPDDLVRLNRQRPAPDLTLDTTPDSSGWTLDLKDVSLPDTPVAGRVHGLPFKVERVQVEAAALNFRQGSGFFPDREFSIVLFEPDPAKLSGRTIVVPNEAVGFITPHILMKWKEAGKELPEMTSADQYSMRLEFGELKGGKLPGRIYLCVLDREKSFIRGKFEVAIREGFRSPGP